ncbi:MAG: hypothetical protein PHE25_06160 [Candidatus Gracilibacteria bacterium]|nr:hypothetical protein [Candidatus Gracilibacteria bacterium]
MFQNEKIIETKICKHCQSSFEIYQKDKEMLELISPIFSGNKFILPLPTDCPKCRRQKRLAFRNISKLYRRKCDFSGNNIFSSYDENVKHPVYDTNIWDSDKWSPLDYGMDFDFSKSFFTQFDELKDKVPMYSRSIFNIENSDYCNNASYIKDCYLCFGTGYSENCYYSISLRDAKNCFDCYGVNLSENCFECVDCNNCNKLFYSQNSNDCSNSYFLKNCNNCKNCFGCKNLVNQNYCIFNKRYEKADYEKKVKDLLENTFGELKREVNQFFVKVPEKYTNGVNCENVIGEYINNSKNVFLSFDIINGEDLRYCSHLKDKTKNLMDVDIFGWGLERCYESVSLGHNSSNIYFSFHCWENTKNLFYCSFCVRNVSNCFGCIGLHDGYEYCILNKQYTKEEYELLVLRIIEHMQKTKEWGRFFHQSFSSYGYNQTEGIFSDPMNKKEAIEKGFKWSDYEPPFPKVDKIIPANKLPENIADIPDDILNRAIECEITKKPFRIIKQELEFYRKHNLPISKRHPDQRHLDRMALRNPRKLFDRKCDKCGKNIKTTYSPERLEIVYCEECYNKEIY